MNRRLLEVRESGPSLDSTFRVSVHRTECCHVIGLTGELDLATAPTLATVIEGLTEAPGGGTDHLICDVSQLGFIDSTGLRVLIRGSDLVEGRLWLKGCPQQLMRLLELTSVTDLFCLERDEDLAHRLISPLAD